MSLNLTEKKAIVDEISLKVASAQAIVLAEYRGVNVADITDLRVKARASGVYLRVLKNTLVRRAVDDTSFAMLAEDMVGPLLFGIATDPIAVAKVMYQFSQSHDNFVIKAGAVPHKKMNVTDIQTLANLPPREELLSKLLGTMQAPVAKFVRTLNEVPSKFVRTLAAVHQKKTT